MRSVLEAGFIFWGLFLVFGLVVVAYLVWMLWVERGDR
jgi:phage shock protein PspC (stress-responsive transcriptional regulator)